MLLALIAARQAATMRALAEPTRSRAVFWIMWFTSLSEASSCSWLLARFVYSPMSSPLSVYLGEGEGEDEAEGRGEGKGVLCDALVR